MDNVVKTNKEDINNCKINVKSQKRNRNNKNEKESIIKKPKLSIECTSISKPDKHSIDYTVEKNPLLTELDKDELGIKSEITESKCMTGEENVDISILTNGTDTVIENNSDMEHESKKANCFIESTNEILCIDYENMCTRLHKSANYNMFAKDLNHPEATLDFSEEIFIPYMNAMRANQWQFVLPAIFTRFNTTVLAPTIVIRCLFHFILTTSNSELLKYAITGIQSYWSIHNPAFKYAKKYYQTLLMESENLQKYPASVKGPLFNDIFDKLISALLDEKYLKQVDDIKQVADTDSINFDHLSKQNSDESDSDNDLEEDQIQVVLPPEEQLNRLFCGFKLLIDLLETDFTAFLMKNKTNLQQTISMKGRQPLFIKLKNLPDFETVFKTFVSCKDEDHAEQIFKYINLHAEVVRVQGIEQEDGQVKHPYFSRKCTEFADKLLELIMKGNQEFKILSWIRMCPPWLQMLMFCRWITDKIAITAEPTFMFVVKILKLCTRKIPSIPTQRDCNANLGDKPTSPKTLKKQHERLLRKYKINKKSLLKRNPEGETKLMQMCRSRKADVVEAMLSLKDINVNAKCFAGWSALHEATIKGQQSIVRMLLAYKPDVPDLKPVNVYASNLNGVTSLHDAAKSNHLEICKLLIEKGGGRLLEMETKNGETAINMATKTEVKEYFKEVLNNCQKIDYSKAKVCIDLEMLDIILLRELSFNIMNVYCLHDIIKIYNQKLKGVVDSHCSLNRDRVILKADCNNISNNIKAWEELKSILRDLSENQDQLIYMNSYESIHMKHVLSNWLTVIN